MDLAGDGQPDLVVLDGPLSGLYQHDQSEGWESFRPFTEGLNLDTRDPNLKFVDMDGNGHADVLISGNDAFVWRPSLADLSWDGLTDLARIRNGEVGYWPKLGYACFGAKITMNSSPWFDDPDLFDHKRIRLADIDGTGTTDIIYLYRDRVRSYSNHR